MITGFAELVYQCAVIPERPLLFAGKAVEDFVSLDTQVVKGFARVGEFVRRGDQAYIAGFGCNALDVGTFALHPRRLGLSIRIGAALNNVSDALAKLPTNFAETRQATLVLDCVVQQGGDGHFFVAPVLDDYGGDTEEMADVGPVCALANLAGVQARGIVQGAEKAV